MYILKCFLQHFSLGLEIVVTIVTPKRVGISFCRMSALFVGLYLYMNSLNRNLAYRLTGILMVMNSLLAEELDHV